MAKLIGSGKPISGPSKLPLKTPRDIPMIKVDEVAHFNPPKGLDLTSRKSRIPLEYCADVNNMILDDATIVTRPGTSAVGSVASDVMSVIGVTTPEHDIGYLLRTTVSNLERWSGTSWTIIASPFTGGLEDYFSFTLFGRELLMVNGVDKVFSYNLETGENGFIEESVVAKHITSWNGRVVVSNTTEETVRYPFRTRWSVKNDSVDWTGDGSGFEDLFATPGGAIDTVHGVFPLSDDTALIVRANSVWIMSATGNLLAPHRFSRIFAKLGTKMRRSIASVPGGVVFVSHKDIVAVSSSDIQYIGSKVRKPLISSVFDPDVPVGIYDEFRNEYRLAVGQMLWRYSFEDGGWTKGTYPFAIRDMTRVNIPNFGLTWDEAVGTWDEQTLTWDEAVGANGLEGFLFAGY